MMTLEALFSLLALLIVISMLPAAPEECMEGGLLQMQGAQDAASVLEKSGAIDRFANWAARQAHVGGQEPVEITAVGNGNGFEEILRDVSIASGKCIGLVAHGKSAYACKGEIAYVETCAAEIYATKRIAVVDGGFADVVVEVWQGQDRK